MARFNTIFCQLVILGLGLAAYVAPASGQVGETSELGQVSQESINQPIQTQPETSEVNLTSEGVSIRDQVQSPFTPEQLAELVKPAEAYDLNRVMTLEEVEYAYDQLMNTLEDQAQWVTYDQMVALIGEPNTQTVTGTSQDLLYLGGDNQVVVLLRIKTQRQEDGSFLVTEIEREYRSPKMFKPLGMKASELEEISQQAAFFESLINQLGEPENVIYYPSDQRTIYTWSITGSQDYLNQLGENEITVLELIVAGQEITEVTYATKRAELNP